MLVGFSVSLAFFNDANLGLSVPLVVHPARVPRRAARVHRPAPLAAARATPLRLLVPWQALAMLTLFLLGLRIGLNMIDGNVIDVGYAGVIGADKLAHGRELYGAFPNDNAQGDTYGPLLYLAYVPFELVWPWIGRWNDLPAAHAAAGVFDARVRRACCSSSAGGSAGRELGVVLAYAWVAFPFTMYATNSGTNDALPGRARAGRDLGGRPAVRARGARDGRGPDEARAARAAAAARLARPAARRAGRAAGAVPRRRGARLRGRRGALVLWRTDPQTFWDRTVALPGGPRRAVLASGGSTAAAGRSPSRSCSSRVVLFAVGVAFVPRRDDLVGLAALCGAILAGTSSRRRTGSTSTSCGRCRSR